MGRGGKERLGGISMSRTPAPSPAGRGLVRVTWLVTAYSKPRGEKGVRVH